MSAFLYGSSAEGGKLKKENSWSLNSYCNQTSINFNAIPTGIFTPFLEYPDQRWENDRTYFWCKQDNRELLEILPFDDSDKRKLANKESWLSKTIVFRLFDGRCEIDLDDDPKNRGYSIRCIQK